MTPTRQDLLQALGQIQNHPLYAHQDIMTFTGFMNDAEVREHIEVNLRSIAKFHSEAEAA
jgi:hypothetical protein